MPTPYGRPQWAQNGPFTVDTLDLSRVPYVDSSSTSRSISFLVDPLDPGTRLRAQRGRRKHDSSLITCSIESYRGIFPLSILSDDETAV